MGVQCVGRRLDRVCNDVGLASVTLNRSETQSAGRIWAES